MAQPGVFHVPERLPFPFLSIMDIRARSLFGGGGVALP